MTKTFGGDSGSDAVRRTEEAQRLLDIITAAEREGHYLSGKDAQFVEDLRERFEQYGMKTAVSPRQLFYLRDIRDRVIDD